MQAKKKKKLEKALLINFEIIILQFILTESKILFICVYCIIYNILIGNISYKIAYLMRWMMLLQPCLC